MTEMTTHNRGYDVRELPHPSQSWATLEILNILDQCVDKVYPGQTMASLGPTDARYWHMFIEAKKLGYADLTEYNSDPDFNTIPTALLTSKAYAPQLCSKINPGQASATKPGPAFTS